MEIILGLGLSIIYLFIFYKILSKDQVKNIDKLLIISAILTFLGFTLRNVFVENLEMYLLVSTIWSIVIINTELLIIFNLIKKNIFKLSKFTIISILIINSFFTFSALIFLLIIPDFLFPL